MAKETPNCGILSAPLFAVPYITVMTAVRLLNNLNLSSCYQCRSIDIKISVKAFKMRSSVYSFGLTLIWASVMFISCKDKPAGERNFSKADSVTDSYLSLQDTMLQVWNTMMHDDNRKVKAMRALLHELSVSNPDKIEELKDYESRLDLLVGMRYDQESISNPDIVTEYDFASNSLITELITLAETQKEFAYNGTLQKLVDSIRAADQRVLNYRAQYDEVASKFNRFIEQHEEFLEDMESDSLSAKKPLFQMAAE